MTQSRPASCGFGSLTAHLRRRYSARHTARYFAAWADEDRYFSLDDELAMLRSAGFAAEVVWRDGVFAVVVGRKGARG